MTIATFLFVFLLISLGNSQSSIEIPTETIPNLETSLVTSATALLTSVPVEENYASDIMSYLRIPSMSQLNDALTALGNRLLSNKVTEVLQTVIGQNCYDGLIPCDLVWLKVVVTQGSASSALCMYAADTESIPGVAVLAFDDALCAGAVLSNVIGAANIHPNKILSGYRTQELLLCELGKNCALYIYDGSLNVLYFQETVSLT